MNSVRPIFFYEVGFKIQSVLWLNESTPGNIRADILSGAVAALGAMLKEDKVAKILPRTHGSAQPLLNELIAWQLSQRSPAQLSILYYNIQTFSTIMAEEVDRTHNYTLTGKGNLSIDSLVDGASKGYPKDVLDLIDQFMKDEIDQAGKCLACELYTACGFQILRSVEVGVKAYVHAATGSLPPLNRRNWGEYIALLKSANAHADLTDVLAILKSRRNPLMHPKDKLDEAEAIDLLCISQAVTGTLIADVKRRTMEAAFQASLKVLPTI